MLAGLRCFDDFVETDTSYITESVSKNLPLRKKKYLELTASIDVQRSLAQ